MKKTNLAFLFALSAGVLASCGGQPAASSSSVIESVTTKMREDMAGFMAKAVSKTVSSLGTITITEKLSNANIEVSQTIPATGSTASQTISNKINNLGFTLTVGVKDLFSKTVANIDMAAKIEGFSADYDLNLGAFAASASIDTSSAFVSAATPTINLPEVIKGSFKNVGAAAYIDNNNVYADLSNANLQPVLINIMKMMYSGMSEGPTTSMDSSTEEAMYKQMLDALLGEERKVIIKQGVFENPIDVQLPAEAILKSALLQNSDLIDALVKYTNLQQDGEGYAWSFDLSKEWINKVATAFGQTVDLKPITDLSGHVEIKFDSTFRLYKFEMNNIVFKGADETLAVNAGLTNVLSIDYGVAPTMPENYDDYQPIQGI